MTVYAYTPSTSTFYRALGITVQPGDVIDFGSALPPADDTPYPNTPAGGQLTPSWTAKWTVTALTPNATLQTGVLPDLGSRYMRRAPGLGGAPTLAAGANAGTAPPAPVVDAGSSDARGGLTFGTGATPAAGAQVVVTFTAAMPNAPVVQLTPRNATTQPLGLFVSSVTTTGFTVSTVGAPAASQANTIYSLGYVAIS